MRSFINKISLASLCILFTQFSFAQISSRDSIIKPDEVVTDYIIDVQESKKIDIQPALEDPKVDPPTYNYRFSNLAYKPKAVYSPIDPIFLKKEKDKDLYDNYIEIGGGNYLTSYVDASIHNTQDKYYMYGLNLKHHAASSSKNPNQGLFSQNRITAFGEREKGSKLKGVIDYQRNVVHYYGYLDSSERPLGDINQIYNDINANAIWSSRKGRHASSVLDFGFNIFDKIGENESTFALKNSNDFFLRNGDLYLDLGLTYTQLTEKAKYNRFFIDINPHYEFKHKQYHLDLGVNVNYLKDSNSNLLFFAPHIKGETYLVPDKLRAFVSLTGGLQKNTLKRLSYENMFLGNINDFENPQTVFDLAAGMNGNFKRFIEFGITMSQKQVKDQYLFINDTNSLRNFTLVHDDVNTFTFSGELKVDVNDNVDLGFRGNFYSYSLASEAQAWHMPTYDVALFATVRIADKIYIRGGYFGTSTRQSRDLSGLIYNLKAINDVNAGFEYRYKKNISGFLNINNILNQNYALWNQYNAQGINVLAGVTFSSVITCVNCIIA